MIKAAADKVLLLKKLILHTKLKKKKKKGSAINSSNKGMSQRTGHNHIFTSTSTLVPDSVNPLGTR